MHALLVEDDPGLGRALTLTLRSQGWSVTSTTTGRAALAAAAAEGPDVIVLDLGLPDVDGVDLLRTLRRRSRTPVVVLSARDQSAEKVRALDAGADDYVTKPFGVDELLARLRAAVRRGAADDALAVVDAGDLRIDLRAARVLKDGAAVRLTPTEWHLLEVLVRRRGRLVPHRVLLQEVWGPGYGTESHYLRVYLAQLRRKLERDPSRPRHLLTEPGLGYRFEP